MKCQACEKTATLHVTEMVAGRPVEFHVCSAHLENVAGMAADEGPWRPETGLSGFMDAPELRKVLFDPNVRQKVTTFLV
jgi:hypothetical protein